MGLALLKSYLVMTEASVKRLEEMLNPSKFYAAKDIKIVDT